MPRQNPARNLSRRVGFLTISDKQLAGNCMAELNRLDWTAIDLERRIIEVRAGQAKTASRRVIPISDNLAAWLEPFERQGKVVRGVESE